MLQPTQCEKCLCIYVTMLVTEGVACVEVQHACKADAVKPNFCFFCIYELVSVMCSPATLVWTSALCVCVWLRVFNFPTCMHMTYISVRTLLRTVCHDDICLGTCLDVHPFFCTDNFPAFRKMCQ